MGDKIEIFIGQKTGQWTIISLPFVVCKSGHSRKVCEVQCECGAIREVRLLSLELQTSKSCASCRVKKQPRKKKPTEELKKTKSYFPEYRTWISMKSRCLNSKVKQYPYYGGRGIKVHEPWLLNFECFLEYIGPKPDKNYTLDRIDPNGNYEPGNVRWASRAQQSTNTRKNINIIFNGEIMCLTYACQKTNINISRVQMYIRKKKMSPQDAFDFCLNKPSKIINKSK